MFILETLTTEEEGVPGPSLTDFAYEKGFKPCLFPSFLEEKALKSTLYVDFYIA